MNTVGANTIAGLRTALMARMVTIAAGLPLLATRTSEPLTGRPATVRGWQLPPKPSAEAEEFPFLLVRVKSGVDSPQGANEDAKAVADIVIGTYSDTDDGEVDLHLLIDAIRLSLASAPVLAETAFEHTGPLTWEIPDEQPRPQWIGKVTTNWTIPRPERVEALNPTKE